MPEESLAQKFLVLPSMLSCDFARVGEQLDELTGAGCEMVHLDVMDGHFTPNLTFGPPFVKSLAEATGVAFDVHLMVTDPDCWTEAFDFPNTRCLTIHAEAGYHLHRSLERIRDRGKMAGLALNPATSEEVLEHLWPSLDLVLVMTVNPGFGGQRFIEACRRKIANIRRLIDEKTEGRVVLEIDGGVGSENLPELAQLGAQWVVIGNALFGPGQLASRYRELQTLGSGAWVGRQA